MAWLISSGYFFIENVFYGTTFFKKATTFYIYSENSIEGKEKALHELTSLYHLEIIEDDGFASITLVDHFGKQMKIGYDYYFYNITLQFSFFAMRKNKKRLEEIGNKLIELDEINFILPLDNEDEYFFETN